VGFDAEIFPTAIRSTANGAAYSLSRATSTVLPFVAVPALTTLGPVAVFSGTAVLIVLLCLDVVLLGPRSTGLTLEAVDPGLRCLPCRQGPYGLCDRRATWRNIHTKNIAAIRYPLKIQAIDTFRPLGL
jgi:hypothetical protein